MFDFATRACRTKLMPVFRSALQPRADFNGATSYHERKEEYDCRLFTQGERACCSDHSQPGTIRELQMLEFL